MAFVMAKKKRPAGSISNRRARHDYALDDVLIVGIELTGAETKAMRRGHAQLQGAYVNIKDNQLWLINASVNGDPSAPISEIDQTRTRRLLAKRKEIDNLTAKKQQGMSIVPLEVLTGGRYIKLRIATGRGKRKYDKRQTIKKRDEERAMQRGL